MSDPKVVQLAMMISRLIHTDDNLVNPQTDAGYGAVEDAVILLQELGFDLNSLKH